MRRRGLDLKNAVLRHLAVAGLALLIGSGGVFAQSGTPAPDQTGKPPAANSADATKDNQRKTDEFVEARRRSTARPATRNASGSAAAWSA